MAITVQSGTSGAAGTKDVRSTTLSAEEVQHVILVDASGNVVETATTDPASGARGAVVRPLPTTRAVTTATNARVSVGTSATQLLAANTSRKFASVTNVDTDVVHLRLGTPAVTTDLPLEPGQSFTVEVQGGFIYTGVLSAIAVTTARNVNIVEW